MEWYHPTKNACKLLGDYMHHSAKRVWLQCPGCPSCGEVHHWDAQACRLTRQANIRCPSCSGNSSRISSCTAVSANERLMAEWHGDNPSPDTLTMNSSKVCRWRCSEVFCRHVWEDTPHHCSAVGSAN
jgi:predicted RNA-binding Zn-ribbon protein involved in translation (DUF1610 family)